MRRKSFEEWKQAVTEHVRKMTHHMLDAEDLPDIDYYSMYDVGMSPALAANRALKNTKEY